MKLNIQIAVGPAGNGAAQVKAQMGGIASGAREAKTEIASLEAKVQGLKTMLAGVAAAWAALGVTRVLRDAVNAAAESERAVAQLEARVRSTAGAAGLTTSELSKFAEELQRVVGVEDDVVIAAESMLLTFKNLHGDTFKRATTAVLDYATAMNNGVLPSAEQMKSAAIQVGKALNDPIKGLSAMAKAGVQFSAEQAKAIEKLVKTGQIAKAQAIILKELESQFGGSAKAAGDAAGPFHRLSVVIGDLLERLGGKLLPALHRIQDDVLEFFDSDADLTGGLIDRVGTAISSFIDGFRQGLRTALQEISEGFASINVADLSELGRMVGEVLGGGLRLAAAAARFLASNIDLITAAIAGFAAYHAVLLFVQMAEAVNKAVAAMLALNATMAANPIGAIAALVGLAAGAWTLYALNSDSAADAIRRQNTALDENRRLLADITALQGRVTANTVEELRRSLLTLEGEYQKVRSQQTKLYEDRPDAMSAWDQLTGAVGRYEEKHEVLIQQEDKLANAIEATKDQLKLGEAQLKKNAEEEARRQKLLEALGTTTGEVTKQEKKRTDELERQRKANAQLVAELTRDAAVWSDYLEAIGQGPEAVREHTLHQAGLTAVLRLQGPVTAAAEQLVYRLARANAEASRVAQEYADSIKTAAESIRIWRKEATEALLASANATFAEVNPLPVVVDPEKNREVIEKIKEQYRQAAAEIAAYIREPISQAFATMEQDALDFLAAYASGAEVSTKDLIQAWKQMWFRAMAEWLMRWLKTVATGKAAEAGLGRNGQSGGGGGGWGQMFSRWFGGGGQQGGSVPVYDGQGASGAAMSGYGYMGGAGGTTGTASAAGGAGMSAAAVVGMYAALLVAVYMATEAIRKKKIGKQWKSFDYDDEDGRLPSSEPGFENREGRMVPRQDAWAKQTRAIWNSITDGLNALFDTIFGEVLKDLPKIGIKVRKNGKEVSAWVNGLLIGTFKDVEEAVNAAIVWAFREADLGNVSEIILAALRNTTAQTVEELQHDLAVAQEIVDLGLTDWERRLREHQQRIEMLRREAARLMLDGGSRNGRPGSGGGPTGGGDPLSPGQDPYSGLDTFGDKSEWSARPVPDTASRRIDEEYRRGLEQLRDDAMAALGDVTVQVRRKIQSVTETLAFLRDHMSEFGLTVQDLERVTREAGQQLFVDLASGLNEFVKDEATRKKLQEIAYKVRIAQLRLEYELIKQMGILTQEEMALLDDLFNRLPEKPPDSGGGRGSGRGQERQSFRDRLREIEERALGEPSRAFQQLTRDLAALAEEGRRLGVTTQEVAHAQGVLRAEFQRGLRQRGLEIAGMGGTDFQQRLREGLDYYKELENLGRLVTGIPDWLLKKMREAFLNLMQQDLTLRIQQFAGIDDPFAAIRLAADKLRKELADLFATGKLTPQERADREAQINAGVAYQTEQATLGILDRMYQYLQDDANYAGQILEIAKRRVKLEFDIIEAQLKLAGIWDRTKDDFGAARDAAMRAAERGTSGKLPGHEPGDSLARTYQTISDTVSDAAKQISDAMERFKRATEDLLEFQRSLRLDDMLSYLNPREQVEEARRRLNEVARQALGGDLSARERFSSVANDFLREFAETFGKGGAYADEARKIEEWLQALLSQTTFTDGNATFGAFGSGGAQAPAAAPTTITVSGGDLTGFATDQSLRALGQDANLFFIRQMAATQRQEQRTADLLDEVKTLNSNIRLVLAKAG